MLSVNLADVAIELYIYSLGLFKPIHWLCVVVTVIIKPISTGTRRQPHTLIYRRSEHRKTIKTTKANSKTSNADRIESGSHVQLVPN